jgi:iron complex outermembrane recepter protein
MIRIKLLSTISFTHTTNFHRASMKIITSFLFLLSINSVFSQSANLSSVKGKIIDLSGNDPIPLAQVVIENQSRGTSTDMEGNFIFKNMAAGTYTLRVTAVGYEEITKTFTISENQELNLDTIRVSSGVVMLKEVEVTSSVISLGDERQTPTATSTVSAREIQEQMGSTEFPEILKSTPGIYTSMAGGSLGAGRVTVRGFSSENTAVMINGIPVNDMENGRVFWSNWGGLNDVTRYKQVQRGLGNSKLAISSVGGTINILSKPSETRKGVALSYALTNSSYRNRIMLTASTGLIKGWAVTASGSRRWGDGYRPGTHTDSWAYYLSVYKKLGERHQFLFTGFGAPQTSSIGFDALQSEYQQYGYLYNKAWGYYQGEVKNRAVNKFHKPQLMLSHYFDLSKKTKLTTNVYASIGKGGQTNIQRTVGSASLNNFYFYDSNGQLNWDTIYAINQANVQTAQTHVGQVTGSRSKYYLENRHNDHQWYGILSSLKSDITEKLALTIGIDGRLYKGQHYATVEDMLGGQYFVDQDQFKNNADNNSLIPNRAVTTGDTVRYNYSSTVNWLGVFGQADYSIGRFDLFLTANTSRTSFYRDGKFNNAAYNSAGVGGYGKSETHSFNNFTSKGGINFRITGRHNVFVNAGYFNRAPFFTNAFVDARVSNQTIDNLSNEEMRSIEAGYGFRSSKVTANLNIYYTKRENFAATESYLVPGGDFSDFLLTDISAIHKGIELDFKVRPMRKLEVNGMLSLGDWRWADNATATVRNNNTLLITQNQQTIYIKNLPVGNAAQTVLALNSRYQLPFYAYVGIGWNYFERLYLDYSPAFRTNPNNADPLELVPFYTFDLFAGKSFRLKKLGHTIRLAFNVNNLLNQQFIVEGNENPGFTPYFQAGRPRIYNIALTYQF